MPKSSHVYLLLFLSVVAVGLLHMFTPIERVVLHDIYRRISYLPIVIAALFFGIRGGLVVAVITSIAYIPHLRHYYHLGPNAYLRELPEILLYFGAGIVIGAVAGKEKQLRIKYQDLSQKIEKSYRKLHTQTSELVAAEEQLRVSQKLSALGQLSASLAHEVKNPLAAIRGAVEILADDFPPEHPKHEFSEILLKETNRLAITVDGILRYSRNRKPSPESTSLEPLSQVLDRVAILLKNEIYKKHITLQVDLFPPAESCLVDGDKMSQVFINLLLNSCESLEERGGVIFVKATCNDKQLEIVFEDNGPGVPEQERENIFTPFYTTRKEGTGLGLTISSRIIESYGGTITVGTREQGSGGVFTILLPEQECVTNQTTQ